MNKFEIELNDNELIILNTALEISGLDLKAFLIEAAQYQNHLFSKSCEKIVYPNLDDENYSVPENYGEFSRDIRDFIARQKEWEKNKNPLKDNPKKEKKMFAFINKYILTNKNRTIRMFREMLNSLKKDDDITEFHYLFFKIFVQKISEIPENRYPLTWEKIKKIQLECCFDENILPHIPFLLLGSSYSFWDKEEKDFESEIISKNANKAAVSRHALNNQKKIEAIEHFQKKHIEVGMSKNQFAKKYHAQYCVSEKTLRNNWLQGLVVK